MTVYNAPIQDISFLLNDVLKLQQQNIPGYDALEPELLQAILEEGGKLASEVLAPLNASGCLLYTSPSPRDQRGSRMPSSA